MRRTLVALLFLAGAAHAQGDAVKVDNAWVRATPPRAEVGAAYVTLTAPAPNRLVGVSSPVADKAQVHEMSMDNGVMRMRETPGIVLPGGQAVTLGPGGYHIMLMGLKAPLKEGQTVPLHLTFASGPAVDVAAKVLGPGASGPRP